MASRDDNEWAMTMTMTMPMPMIINMGAWLSSGRGPGGWKLSVLAKAQVVA